MPSGVILSSSSHGAKQEDVEKVLAAAGLEVEKEESEKTAAIVVEQEPARDDFETEEEFEEAHVAWQDTQKAKEEEGDEDDEEEEERAAAAAEEPKKLSKMQKRIRRATAKALENVNRENADLKRRLEALEKGEKGEKVEERNPRPVRANFDSDEKYEDALIKWGVTRSFAEQAQEAIEKDANERLKANLKHYGAAVAAFKEDHEDWDDVVNQDIPMYPGVQLTIMDPDAISNPAEVIYYLGTHPVYTKNLAEKSPEAAIAEVGRLSARLLKTASGSQGSRASSGNKTPQLKRRAPAPIRPVSTAATSSTLTSADAAKARNYKAFKQAQRAGR